MLTQARVSIAQALIRKGKGGFKAILKRFLKVPQTVSNFTYIKVTCLTKGSCGSGRQFTPSRGWRVPQRGTSPALAKEVTLRMMSFNLMSIIQVMKTRWEESHLIFLYLFRLHRHKANQKGINKSDVWKGAMLSLYHDPFQEMKSHCFGHSETVFTEHQVNNKPYRATLHWHKEWTKTGPESFSMVMH